MAAQMVSRQSTFLQYKGIGAAQVGLSSSRHGQNVGNKIAEYIADAVRGLVLKVGQNTRFLILR